MQRFRRLALVAATALAVITTGCSNNTTVDSPVTAYDNDASSLQMVVGSEQAEVITKLVQPWCDSQHISCKITQMGSVDQARLLQTGDAPYDAFWFASTAFEGIGDTQHKLQGVQPMFSTPIVFAGWKSEMDKLGLTGKSDVPIQDVLNAVESGKTRTWVTNPAQSNSGATVLLGFLNSFAGNGPGVPLTAAQLDSPQVKDGITRFAHAFDHTPPSTGTLMDQCVANPNDCRTLFTYEDLVIQTNKDLVAKGKEPLYAVYPKGALAISNAPLGFLPHGGDANAKKKATFDALQQYLLSQEAQNQLLDLGRRPISSIGLNLPNAPQNVFNPAWGIKTNSNEQQITFPNADVTNTALDRYQTTYRKPTDMVYCLDESGSMADNGKWTSLQQAVKVLFTPVQAAQYKLQLGPQDNTVILAYSGGIDATLTVNGNDATAQANVVDQVVNHLGPDGGTSTYNCLRRAVDFFKANAGSPNKRLVTLMTDGQATDEDRGELAELKQLHAPLLTIGLGSDADVDQLKSMAAATGGAYIDGGDLTTMLNKATGYR